MFYCVSDFYLAFCSCAKNENTVHKRNILISDVTVFNFICLFEAGASNNKNQNSITLEEKKTHAFFFFSFFFFFFFEPAYSCTHTVCTSALVFGIQAAIELCTNEILKQWVRKKKKKVL